MLLYKLEGSGYIFKSTYKGLIERAAYCSFSLLLVIDSNWEEVKVNLQNSCLLKNSNGKCIFPGTDMNVKMFVYCVALWSSWHNRNWLPGRFPPMGLLANPIELQKSHERTHWRVRFQPSLLLLSVCSDWTDLKDVISIAGSLKTHSHTSHFFA